MSVRTPRPYLPNIFSRTALTALTLITMLLMQSACSLGGGGGYAGLYQGTSTTTDTIDGKSTTETSQGIYYVLDGTESDLVIVIESLPACPVKASFDGDKFESKKVRCTIADDTTTITGTIEIEGELADGDLELEATFNGTISSGGQSTSYIIADKFDGKRK